MIDAVKSGNQDMAFDLFFNHIGFHKFLQKCGLVVDSNLPHRISWGFRIEGSNYKTIGVNRTLDGGTTPILKNKFFCESLYFELDWLNEKIVVKGRNMIIHEIPIELDSASLKA